MTDDMSKPERPALTSYLAEFGERIEHVEARVGQSAPLRRPSRWRRPLAVTVGLATAGLVGALVVAPAVTSLDPVSEARAALGDPGDLVHFVVIASEDAKKGKTSPCAERGPTEVWQATSGIPRWRVVRPGMSKQCGSLMAWDGTPTPGPIESARDGDTQTTWYPQIRRLEVITETGFPATGDSPFRLFGGPEPSGAAARSSDPIQRLRALLDDGTLREGSRSRVDGREVVHLVGRTVAGGTNESRFDLAVDATTFTPVRFTVRYLSDFARLNPNVTPNRDGWSSWTTDFVTYEQRPMDAEAERELTIRPSTKPKTEFRFTKAEFERRARTGSSR